MRWVLVLLSVLILAGCTDQATPRRAADPSPPAIGGARPVKIVVPPGYRPGRPAPLLLMLHGYGGSAAREEGYFGFTAVAAASGMLYALPQGTPDKRGNRFWNATAACCDKDHTNIDDSAYLRGVIEDIRRHYAVDPKRVFVTGISNGGFMSHRMACDHADLVAGIASLAGAGPLSTSDCRNARPVAVLQIHGDADPVIRYEGGMRDAEYPGAVRTVEDWARRDGCAVTARGGPARDLADADDVFAGAPRPLDGPETRTVSYPDGCRPGGHAELWTVTGGAHAPRLAPTYARQVVDFLLAHPKP